MYCQRRLNDPAAAGARPDPRVRRITRNLLRRALL
jgi:hypothetical protein